MNCFAARENKSGKTIACAKGIQKSRFISVAARPPTKALKNGITMKNNITISTIPVHADAIKNNAGKTNDSKTSRTANKKILYKSLIIYSSVTNIIHPSYYVMNATIRKAADMAIKIFIDQGHNPNNPNAGAEGNGLREQDIVFRIGILLNELFSENPQFETRLSRPTLDVQLGTSNTTSLIERVRLANEWGADYFLSLHTNASSQAAASGTEAFAYSSPSAAFSLGEDIVQSISEYTGLKNRGMKVRSGLYVLRKTNMPAVLIELGFITNPNDASLMVNEPELFAEAIYQGTLEYLGLQ